MFLQLALATTLCPSITTQSLNGTAARPVLNVSYDNTTYTLHLELSIPYTTDYTNYTYQVDFSEDMSFVNSNFDNITELEEFAGSGTLTPCVDYVCSQKTESHFKANDLWSISIDECNYLTMEADLSINDTVFETEQTYGNVIKYLTTLYLNKYSNTDKNVTQTFTYKIDITQRIAAGYEAKELAKLSYFAPLEQVQDYVSIFQAKLEDDHIKFYLGVDQLQIISVESDIEDEVSYETKTIKEVCNSTEEEQIVNVTRYSAGGNARTLTVTYKNVDCDSNTTDTESTFKVYLFENVTTDIEQTTEQPFFGFKVFNTSTFKVDIPESIETVNYIACDDESLSGITFSLENCTCLSISFEHDNETYLYEAQLAEASVGNLTLYEYEPYETLENMSWNDGYVCDVDKEEALATAYAVYCDENEDICAIIEGEETTTTEEEETVVEETTQETPDTDDGGVVDDGNDTVVEEEDTIEEESVEEEEECVGDNCVEDGVEGINAIAAGVIGILGLGLLV